MDHDNEQLLAVLTIFVIVGFALYRRRWIASRTAFGKAEWASEKCLRRAGMFGRHGLILGRTLNGRLIRLREYCHILLVGPTGSGKGEGFIKPQLSKYPGSVICFDPKADLYASAAAQRSRMGQRVICLAPSKGDADTLNPCDTIPADSPTLIDDARVTADSIVVRQGTEPDPHWCDKSVQVICALLVLVLMRFEGEERSLSSVQEIASDPKLIFAAAEALRDIGGIPERLGNQLGALFADGESMQLTREGASIMSSVQKFLGFLDSPSAATSVARTTFPLKDLWEPPGSTIFIQVGLERLEAQRPLIRCWLTTLMRVIGRAGDERKTQVLFLLDEFSALVGNGLTAVEEALVRGRQAGIRLVIVCQSDSQVKAAFKHTPELIYDNCSTHIYLPPSSIETAERLSKCLGDFTQVVESAADNESMSRQEAGLNSQNGSKQLSRGCNRNWQPQGRALMRPEELLTMSRDHLIVLVGGMPPILARRVKYFADPLFGRAPRFQRSCSLMWWFLLATAVLSMLWAVVEK